MWKATTALARNRCSLSERSSCDDDSDDISITRRLLLPGYCCSNASHMQSTWSSLNPRTTDNLQCGKHRLPADIATTYQFVDCLVGPLVVPRTYDMYQSLSGQTSCMQLIRPVARIVKTRRQTGRASTPLPSLPLLSHPLLSLPLPLLSPPLSSPPSP